MNGNMGVRIEHLGSLKFIIDSRVRESIYNLEILHLKYVYGQSSKRDREALRLGEF